MSVHLHQRATAQRRRRIAAWRAKRGTKPKPERTPLREYVAAGFGIAVVGLAIGWPIYGLLAN